nr:unnamed protein product [Callosobruchus chinensis]
MDKTEENILNTDTEDAFISRDSIIRALSEPNWDVEEGSLFGRKEEDPKYTEKTLELDELDQTVQKLLSRARDLEESLKSCVNTKLVIKKAGADIYQLSLKLNRLNKKRLKHNTTNISKVKPLTVETGSQTEAVSNTTNEISTQTLKDEEMETEVQSQIIREKLCSAETLTDLRDFLDLEWPRIVFEKLHEEPGDVLAAPWEYDLVNFSTCGLEMSKGVSRRFRERYGGLAELKAQNRGIGDVAYLISSIAVPTPSGIQKKDRYIWNLITEREPLTLNETETLYEATCKLRELMISNGRHRLAIPYMPTYNWNHVEKILEFVFKDTNIHICVYRYEKTRTKQKKKPMDSGYSKPKNGGPTREAVCIEAQGKTYAELLRSIRKDVNLDNINAELSKVRQTKKGDVLLEVKKGNAAELQLAINKQMHGIRAMMMTKESVLHVKGLDGITTKEEILEAVTKAIDGIRSCRVTSLRPAYGGTQNATVILDTHAAEQLTKLASIRVGLVQCEVRLRKPYGRCRRCWDIGHTEKECSGTDRSKMCLKCAHPGHKASDCTGKTYCPICETFGHQVGRKGCKTIPKTVTQE